MSCELIACVFLLTACGTEDFPGSPDLAGERDVPYVTTYNFGFDVGFTDVSGINGNLQIISGGDLLNLISAANITQAAGTGVVGGRVFGSTGSTVENVVLAATDVDGRKVGDFFYNGLGGTPDFVQTRGTVSTGGFTAFNVTPGEIFLKAVAGGRGGGRLVAFPDEVSLGTVSVVPVVLPALGVTGEINDTTGAALTEGDITIEVLGQSLSEAGDCNDEVPSQDAVEAQRFRTLTAFRFCVASDGEYWAKLTGDSRFVTTYHPFKADRARLAAEQAAELTEFFAIQTAEGLQQAARVGGRAVDKGKGIMAGRVTLSDGAPLGGAAIRVTDGDGVELAVPNGLGTEKGTIWYVNGAGLPIPDQRSTGPNGRFLIVNLPSPSTVYLSATAEAETTGVPERYTGAKISPIFTDSVVYQPFQITSAPPPRQGEDSLERYFTGPVSGRVMTEDGLSVVSGARILPLGVPLSELPDFEPQVFTTDVEGRYDIPVSPVGPLATTPLLGSSSYLVAVEGPTTGYAPTYQKITTGTATLDAAGFFVKKIENLAILETSTVQGFAVASTGSAWDSSGGTIYGTVVDRVTGRPGEGIVVRVLPFRSSLTAAPRVYYFDFAGTPDPELQATSADGRFIAFNVPPGSVSVDVVSLDDTGNVLTESMAGGVSLVQVLVNNAPPELVDLTGTVTPLAGSLGSGLTLSVVGGDPLPMKMQCPSGTEERRGLCFIDPKLLTGQQAKVAIGCENVAVYGPFRVERDGYCVMAYGAVSTADSFTVPVGSENDLVLKTSGSGFLDTYTSGFRTGARGVVNAAVGAVKKVTIDQLASSAQLTRRAGSGVIWGRTITPSLGAANASGEVTPLTCATWTDPSGSGGCGAIGTPGAVATGWFNADVTRDLAVIDTGSPAVTIWLNRGNGDYVRSQRIARNAACYVGNVGCGVEDGPAALVVVDYNGDGRSDIVLLNRTSRTISLLEGRGRGRFVFGGSIEISPEGTDPNVMASADFNRDGRHDLLVTDRVSGQLILLLGTGAGFRPFRPTLSPLDVGEDPRMVTSGFLDGDGIPDLVFANAGSVAVLSRIGVTGGNRIVAYRFPDDRPTDLRAAAIGDLNADGVNDVVVADAYPGNPRIWIFLGGVQSDAVPVSISAGPVPTALALIDINGDRALDLIVVHEGDGTVLYRPGDGGGGFGAPEVLTVGGHPKFLVVDDVTGDGLVDAILSDPNPTASRIAIVPQTTSPAEGIAVAAVQTDGRAIGEAVYLDASGTGVASAVHATGSSGRFMILNVPPGPVWLHLLNGGTGSRFLYAYPDGVTNTTFPVIAGPTSTVFIQGATVDAVVRPVGEVQIRFLGTQRATSSSPLVFDERGNLAGGASYSTLVEANSDYIIRLSK